MKSSNPFSRSRKVPPIIPKRSFNRIDNDNDNDNNNNNNNNNEPISQSVHGPTTKKKKKNPNINSDKKDIQHAIGQNQVDFKDDSTIPNSLLRQYCKWPFDKSGNPFKNGDYIVCRMPEYGNNGAVVGYCNCIYKYFKNGGYDSIHRHYKSKHKTQYDDWKAQQQPKQEKNYKYNTLSLTDVPVQKYKDKLAKILAKGVCKHFRPFSIANDTWIAELASFFTHIGDVHGPLSANEIRDSV